MELSLATGNLDGCTVLEVGGEVDVYTAPRLRERLLELIDQGTRKLILDIVRVDFLDSGGLGVLVGALKHLRARNGGMVLVVVREPLMKIFRITALDQVFAFAQTVEEAAAMFNGSAPAPAGGDRKRPTPGSAEKARQSKSTIPTSAKKGKKKSKGMRPPPNAGVQPPPDRSDPVGKDQMSSSDRVREPTIDPGWTSSVRPARDPAGAGSGQADVIVEMYVSRQMGIWEIGERLGVAPRKVWKHLHAQGLGPESFGS